MQSAHCMKCKKRQAIVSPKIVTMANGRRAVTGTCAVCGAKVAAIVGAAPVPAKGGCNTCGKR